MNDERNSANSSSTEKGSEYTPYTKEDYYTLEDKENRRSSSALPVSKKKKIEMHSVGNPHSRRTNFATFGDDYEYRKDLKIVGEKAQLSMPFRRARSVNESKTEIHNFNTKIMTLKTQKANEEFNNFKLEDEFLSLKEELNAIEDDIEELKHHETESLKALEGKFELTRKTLAVTHEEKLHKLKECVSRDVEILIEEKMKRHAARKKDLASKCEALKSRIKAEEQDLNRKLIKLKEDHNKKLIHLNSNMDDNIESLQKEIEITKSEISSQTRQLQEKSSYLNEELISKSKKLLSKLDNLKSKFHGKEMEISNLKNQISSMEATNRLIVESFDRRKQEIEDLESDTRQLASRLSGEEALRRSLHERLQQLKGNIRVFCRIKPHSNDDSEQTQFDILDEDSSDGISQTLVMSKDVEQIPTRSSIQTTKSNCHTFSFDKVFGEDVSNEDIFEELSQLIQSSLDGFNVCVFAYGQTGSGKTWTMSHPHSGMISLSVDMIFDTIEDLKSKEWTYTVKAEVLEIYNESIIDLLTSSGTLKKHEIKHDDVNCKTSITNMTCIDVDSREKAKSIISMASKNRSTASTKLNERSSRSHSICTFKIEGVNLTTGEKREGNLNLIDLAGSERLYNSQAKGDRLKETQAINKSLSSLGDVICSLGQQQNSQSHQQHIPFRNSKLTYLLKHSLQRDSKTLMFVNLSPSMRNFNETLNSLRFATKVNNTKLKSK